MRFDMLTILPPNDTDDTKDAAPRRVLVRYLLLEVRELERLLAPMLQQAQAGAVLR